MKKAQADYYLKRIYALANTGEVVVIFKPIRMTRGETDKVDTIWLNPNENILPTFIHECLHILYPGWTEKKVQTMETAIFSKLTPRQLANLLFKIGELVCFDEE